MSRESRTIPVPLAMLRFSTLPQDLDEGYCLVCDAYLELYQPDADAPDRLVGICERCSRWYLIDIVPGTDDAVMILLPKGGYFQDALADGLG